MLPAPGITVPLWEMGKMCHPWSSKDGKERGYLLKLSQKGYPPTPACAPAPWEGRPLTCWFCSHELVLGGRAASSSDMPAAP